MSTIESLDRLRSEFVRLAEAELDAIAQPRQRHPRLRTRAFAVTAIGFAVAVVAIVLTTHGGAGSASGGAAAGTSQVHGSALHGSVSGFGTQRGLNSGPWSAKHPFPNGRPVSLEHAVAALGRPIPFPHDPLTGPSHLGPITLVTGGRIRGATDTFVATSYPESRLAVEYETPVPYPNPAANYRGYVAADQQSPNLHHLAYVGSVAGRPALVIRLHADSLGTNPASVEFVLHGLSIAVIGYQPASVLLRVADSIARNDR